MSLPSIDFHAHHSPLGAYTTFTCGRFAAGGGLTVQGAKPADHEIVIGYRDGEGQMHVLPFAKRRELDVNLEIFAEVAGARNVIRRQVLDQQLTRDYRRGTDTWACGDFSFTIFTPAAALPDPAVGGAAALARAAIPAITARLRLDNRASAKARSLVFALGPNANCHLVAGTGDGVLGVGWGRECALATAQRPGVRTLLEWNEYEFFANARPNHLGNLCGFVLDVPAGEIGELDVVLATHRDGIATTGIDASFHYLAAYPTLASVLVDAVARQAELRAGAEALDNDPAWLALDADRRLLVSHAERSYWGNTWLLERGGEPLWVVLEGEYAMINTFDLTVDMVFYELRRNPWTVRNVLDQFVARYSYHDRLARPVEGAMRTSHHTFARNPNQLFQFIPRPAETDLPGGISFCHDMGVAGHFTAPGYSSYECSRLAGCFSYMTGEQLLNWILTAASYVIASGDRRWLADREPVFRACLRSFLNRDDPVASRRTGVIALDSSRCDGGWEITTYDSLDPSLGQARNNLYMAVKGFAAWLGLERVFTLLGDDDAARESAAGAQRAAATVAGRFDDHLGYIPAVFEAGNASAIIPAVEGLIFPLVWGMSAPLAKDGPHAGLIAILDRHLRAVLRPGVCLFDDGGWKLSSTSDNSWASKIFISQVVAERVFSIPIDARSHAAHVHWQVVGSKDWAMSDQCIRGVGTGSKYYPRCVTADLWLALR